MVKITLVYASVRSLSFENVALTDRFSIAGAKASSCTVSFKNCYMSEDCWNNTNLIWDRGGWRSGYDTELCSTMSDGSADTYYIHIKS